MDLIELGYSDKWLKYGFLKEEQLTKQISAYKEDEDPGHFRFDSLCEWLHEKDVLSNREIGQFLEIAREDEDQLVAGSALRELFTSPLLDNDQFEMIKARLPEFGAWTKKLIDRETLLRQIESEEVTEEIFEASFNYKSEFKDNRPLFALIEKAENIAVLAKFADAKCGKQLRKLAEKKIKRLEK